MTKLVSSANIQKMLAAIKSKAESAISQATANKSATEASLQAKINQIPDVSEKAQEIKEKNDKFKYDLLYMGLWYLLPLDSSAKSTAQNAYTVPSIDDCSQDAVLQSYLSTPYGATRILKGPKGSAAYLIDNYHIHNFGAGNEIAYCTQIVIGPMHIDSQAQGNKLAFATSPDQINSPASIRKLKVSSSIPKSMEDSFNTWIPLATD